MMTPQELAAKYFDTTISPSEMVLLNEMIENDEDFKAEFELEKDLKKALISKKKDSLKSVFKEIEMKSNDNKTSYISEEISNKKRPFNLKYLIAALAVIAIGTTLFFTMSSNSLSNEEIFAKNFEPYRNIIAPVTRSDDDKTPEELAFALYEQGNFAQATKDFNTLFLATEKPYYLFYQANAMLKEGDTESAIAIFKEHQEFHDNFYEKSRWYLALAYLNDDNTEDALPILKELVDKKGFEWKRAKVIIKNIDE
ncbi:MAG: tetratricopeptide repeat protein [Patiriisocius sp.]|uniref:tetratricopeptide repeat protein n=1 Tax=Patiriisocius sp. TaxID=2822396 RepID=UPI003EF29A20